MLIATNALPIADMYILIKEIFQKKTLVLSHNRFWRIIYLINILLFPISLLSILAVGSIYFLLYR